MTCPCPRPPGLPGERVREVLARQHPQLPVTMAFLPELGRLPRPEDIVPSCTWHVVEWRRCGARSPDDGNAPSTWIGVRCHLRAGHEDDHGSACNVGWSPRAYRLNGLPAPIGPWSDEPTWPVPCWVTTQAEAEGWRPAWGPAQLPVRISDITSITIEPSTPRMVQDPVHWQTSRGVLCGIPGGTAQQDRADVTCPGCLAVIPGDDPAIAWMRNELLGALEAVATPKLGFPFQVKRTGPTLIDDGTASLDDLMREIREYEATLPVHLLVDDAGSVLCGDPERIAIAGDEELVTCPACQRLLAETRLH